VDFFVRFQYYLQAGIKLLLFNVMAEALSTVVDNTKAMREKPIKKVLKVLARKKDVNRILMSHRVDTLTNEIFFNFRSQEAWHSNATTVAAQRRPERSPSDTTDNLDAIQEVDCQADDSSLAPQVAKDRSKDLAPCEDDRKAASKNGSKVSLAITVAHSSGPSPFMKLRILELGSGLSKARHSDGGKRRKVLLC